MEKKSYTAIDLFAGCGGLSCGLEQAGFSVVASVEIDKTASEAYEANHPSTLVLSADIREIDPSKLLDACGIDSLDLLAGCPPCQGFSSLRRRNKRPTKRDSRNNLILEYLRFVQCLLPKTILLENVPALRNYYLFPLLLKELTKLGYEVVYSVLNAEDYGVPQRRKRLVLLGSRIGTPSIPQPLGIHVTVREAIGDLGKDDAETDPLHCMHSRHTRRIAEMIEQIPKDGGSHSDLPECYQLACHHGKNIGFSDVYGRMRWDDVSPTITGGCLNPSKGRFLHPEQNRSITAREAALLQTFPKDYVFPRLSSKERVALMIGNALPPRFAKSQALMLASLLDAERDRRGCTTW